MLAELFLVVDELFAGDEITWRWLAKATARVSILWWREETKIIRMVLFYVWV